MTQQTTQQSDQRRAPTFDEDAPIQTLARLSDAIDRWAPQLTNIAPMKRLDHRRFKAVVMSCASRTPKLLLCSYYSLRQSTNAAAELGLELGGVSGEAYLIPYENRRKVTLPNGHEQWISVFEATFMPGYKGFLRLARESGLFRDLGSDVIRPEDTWEPIRRGPAKLQWGHVMGEPKGFPKMKIPCKKKEGWGKNEKVTEWDEEVPQIRGAYAFAKLVDPGADDIVRVLWLDRLEAIRIRSKAGSGGPWLTDYGEMAQKTAIRNLWKHLPKSPAMERAEELDREFDFEETTKDARDLEPSPVEVVTPSGAKVTPAKAKTSRVADRVTQRNAARDAAPPPASSRPADDEPPPSSEPPHDDEGDDHGRQPGEEG